MIRAEAMLVLLPALAAAQASQDPIIRTSTRLVQVDVVVHDKAGPVRNLSKDDFYLTDRGRPQTISIFSIESAPEPQPATRSLAASTFSNRQPHVGAPTSVTAILLDGLNTRFEDQAHAKSQLLKFLENVDPDERIAIYTLNRSLRVLCDFADPQQLRKILGKRRSSTNAEVDTAEPDQSDTGNPELDAFIDAASQTFANAANMDRARITYDAFLAIASHFAYLPGRKNLIWLTGSLPLSLAGAAGALNHANIALYPVDARGLVGMPKLLTAAGTRSGNPRGAPQIPSFRPPGQDTMQELADLTGGRAFYDTNDLRSAIRMALEDSAVTYTLGFYPDSDSLDGKFHDLKVQVRRPGVRVRYRKSYLAYKDAAAPEQQVQGSLAAVLWSPLESTAISLTARVQRTGSSLKFTYAVDIRSLQLAQKGDIRKGVIHVFFIQQDSAGNQLETLQEGINLDLTHELYERYLKSGMIFTKSFDAKPGLATLRVVVIDRENAASGSLIIPIAQVDPAS
jgi:VWFA-related protein